jgi:hypothetical protein
MADETTQQIDNQEQQAPPPPADTGAFTPEQQAKINALMGNTRKESSAAALSKLAEELGYKDVDEMKAAAKEAKTLKDKNMSDLEKAQQRAEAAEAKVAAAEARAAEIEKARIADRVDNKLRSLVSAAKASNTDDVMDLLTARKKAEIEKLVDEDGKIDEKAAEKLIADFKKDKPTLFAVTGHGSPSNRDGRPPQPDNKVVLNRKPSL